MENFSEQDVAKFMAFMRRQQAEENVKATSSATVTEKPEPNVRATNLQTDEDLEFSLKKNFLIEERVRSSISQSKFYEAVSLSEDIESIDEIDVGLKLLIAECYIQLGRENKAEKTISEVENILMKPPKCIVDDVMALAQDFSDNSNYVRALLLLRIASDMFYESELSPDDKVGEISRCISKMDDVIKVMVKPPDASCGDQNITAILRALAVDSSNGQDDASKILSIENKSSGISERTRVLSLDFGVEVMEKMLEKMESIQDADQGNKILRLAQSANLISTHYGTTQFAKAVKILKYGIGLVEKQFGRKAAQYSIYGTMLQNLGIDFHNFDKFKEAEALGVRALEALEYALDHDSEEEKREAIKSAQKSLRITRSHVKLA